jgi:hypothetical protein
MNVLVLAVLILALGNPAAFAAAVSFTAADVTGNFSDGNNRVVGWEFTTNSAIIVTDLGFYDANADGLVESHDIGLYTSGGTLLVSGTVLSGTAGTLDGLFRYVDVADTPLAANETFVIGALILGTSPSHFGDLWIWYDEVAGVNVINPTIDPAISMFGPGGTRFNCCSDTTLTFPATRGVDTGDNVRTAFLGPNFQLMPVPVPAAAWLFGSGVVGLVGIRRRIIA